MSDSGNSAGSGEAFSRGYWIDNLRIVEVLLGIWFVVSFGLGIFLVEPLNQYRLGGFPLGFWFAQQGSIFVFILLVLFYAIWMERLERKHRELPGQEPE